MNAAAIVRQWLEENGYDGLYSPAGECGCPAEELAPCCEAWDDCEPGYRRDCGPGKYDWVIQATRPEPKGEQG
jgi:hypothetical protein